MSSWRMFGDKCEEAENRVGAGRCSQVLAGGASHNAPTGAVGSVEVLEAAGVAEFFRGRRGHIQLVGAGPLPRNRWPQMPSWPGYHRNYCQRLLAADRRGWCLGGSRYARKSATSRLGPGGFKLERGICRAPASVGHGDPGVQLHQLSRCCPAAGERLGARRTWRSSSATSARDCSEAVAIMA